MGNPFLGELRIFGFNFAPKGWAFCNGQLLPIAQNQALFAILGTTYGGNGQTTFGLPNLSARTPMHFGPGYNIGQTGGEETHTLDVTEMPAHIHFATGSTNAPDTGLPTGNYWAAAGQVYTAAGPAVMNPSALGNAGGGQPHANRPPSLALSICIALVGIFPSRT